MTSHSLRVAVALFAALWTGRPMAPLLAPAVLVTSVGEAEARARTSGGYARPSVRTPSPGSLGSGGYRRPPASAGPSMGMPRSDSDLGLSRRGSAEALQRYRAQSAPPLYEPSRRPSTRPDRGTAAWGGRRGWVPPPYAAPSSGLGGVGNALLMWFLLDTLTRPGHAEYFHHHQDDPTYRAWRQQAERRAEDDPELRSKLAALDEELARRDDQPRDPAYRPPETAPVRQGGSGWSMLAVAILAAGLFLMWRARRKMTTSGDGSAVELAGRMARRKLGGQAARASPYRLGMTLTLDPTPFVLAGGAIKVRPPATGLTSVAAIGRLSSGATAFDRLYLPEGQGFYQLAETAAGAVECRFFTSIDQFVPADADEWAFWLDPAEGVIGWPSFETKDGKTYGRAWQPGGRRVEPPRFTEQTTTVDGVSTRQLTAMLYAAPTGMQAPAPATEYVLVAAIEAAGQAWVEVLAGIDVNAASLSLPARR